VLDEEAAKDRELGQLAPVPGQPRQEGGEHAGMGDARALRDRRGNGDVDVQLPEQGPQGDAPDRVGRLPALDERQRDGLPDQEPVIATVERRRALRRNLTRFVHDGSCHASSRP
jgi:hypothetical protein